jgi:hypothetical protein
VPKTWLHSTLGITSIFSILKKVNILSYILRILTGAFNAEYITDLGIFYCYVPAASDRQLTCGDRYPDFRLLHGDNNAAALRRFVAASNIRGRRPFISVFCDISMTEQAGFRWILSTEKDWSIRSRKIRGRRLVFLPLFATFR